MLRQSIATTLGGDCFGVYLIRMRKEVFLLTSTVFMAGVGFSVVVLADSHADSAALDVVIAGGRVMDPESGLDAIRNVGVRGG